MQVVYNYATFIQIFHLCCRLKPNQHIRIAYYTVNPRKVSSHQVSTGLRGALIRLLGDGALIRGKGAYSRDSHLFEGTGALIRCWTSDIKLLCDLVFSVLGSIMAET